ncbi:PTS transporter subunit EIIC [Clostridium sp. CF011]|uniref:PTS transporter subunit EIIC n=1 Tax=Clostridium sp. CF011 TaxID=2843318 RepID=UPI001C0BBDDB|nr:PTS transporter subunit EIIC [Clostridium sp. CF011]MBU3092324.1 PTS transporter subunit EIIC [Clostridium sp. CF011]WAG71420.1 PTS transporter subunit EIIC [Clostridium sp. CF011]
MKNKLQNYFSKLGRSFIMGVAVMSFFGLLLSLGAVLKNPNFVSKFPLLQNEGVKFFANVLNESGLVVIKFMPLVFCVSVAMGMADKGKKELAAFSSLLGYLFMIVFSSLVLNIFGLALEANISVGANNMVSLSQTLEMRKAMQTFVLGIQTIDTGVLGGIVIGTLAATISNRFSNKSLPLIFSFYQGKHFPPILTGVAGLLIGLIVPFVWPFVGGGIYSAAEVVTGAGVIGSFLFGFIERLLIPTGLHHIWYSLAHFTPVGGTLAIGGEVFVGTKAITTAALGNPEFTGNIAEITRVWLGQGATPIKVFGIVGALIGMYLAAKNKEKAKVVVIAAATASVFAGVTEPFEFMFMFLAPPLFLAHCVLSGLSFAILDLVDASYLGGNNIIELIFNGVLQGHKSTWIPIVLVGIGMFFAYMFIFKWYIERFNIITPGRETDEDTDQNKRAEIEASKLIRQNASKKDVAEEILLKIGGKDNIKDYTNCISRLRIFVKDPEKVDKDRIKHITDSLGVSNPSKEEYHIVFGMKVSEYRDAFDEIMEG